MVFPLHIFAVCRDAGIGHFASHPVMMPDKFPFRFCKSLALHSRQDCAQEYLVELSSRGGGFFNNLGYGNYLFESCKIEPLIFYMANRWKVQ